MSRKTERRVRGPWSVGSARLRFALQIHFQSCADALPVFQVSCRKVSHSFPAALPAKPVRATATPRRFSFAPSAHPGASRLPFGMPIYEYISDDGTVIELMRPMSEADVPPPDPENKGRIFRRKLSTFMAPSSGGNAKLAESNSGCCPCGKTRGSCRNGGM